MDFIIRNALILRDEAQRQLRGDFDASRQDAESKDRIKGYGASDSTSSCKENIAQLNNISRPNRGRGARSEPDPKVWRFKSDMLYRRDEFDPLLPFPISPVRAENVRKRA